MKNSKTCFLLNYAPHYRGPIFKLINDKINGDFYFGDKVNTSIKKLDYSILTNFQKEFKRINLFGKFYWLQGSVSLIFKGYDNFILTGEGYCLSNWLIAIYSLFFKKKTFLWTHGWYGREEGSNKAFKKYFYKLTDGLLLYSNYAKELLIKEGFDKNKLTPIYNSLDYDKHLALRSLLKGTSIFRNYFKNNNPTLIYVGRVQKSKRIDLILEAIKILDKKGIKLNFLIVGDNIDADISIKKARDNPNIWIYGSCYDENKLAELFFNSAVCVSPGKVGLTAIHSMSFGTPVITNDNLSIQGPEFEAIIEGETGSFFEEDNVADLADKIITFINISLDMRKSIRDSCFKIIDERYNPHIQVQTLINTLFN